jgi:hypothetical protein
MIERDRPGAAEDRNARRHRHLAGAGLVPERFEYIGAGTDPCEAGIDHSLREGSALTEEAVARVDSVAVGVLRSGDELCGVEIGGRPDTPDLASIVRPPYVERARIVL